MADVQFFYNVTGASSKFNRARVLNMMQLLIDAKQHTVRWKVNKTCTITSREYASYELETLLLGFKITEGARKTFILNTDDVFCGAHDIDADMYYPTPRFSTARSSPPPPTPSHSPSPCPSDPIIPPKGVPHKTKRTSLSHGSVAAIVVSCLLVSAALLVSAYKRWFTKRRDDYTLL